MAWLFLVSLALGAGPDAPEPERAAEAGVPVKVLRYAQAVVARYDQNHDGQLSAAEWSAMRGEPAAIDADRDGQIRVDEFARHVVHYAQRRRIRLMPAFPSATPLPSLRGAAEETAADTAELPPSAPAVTGPPARRFVPPAHRLTGVPDWFSQRDADGDGQLTLPEYAPRQTVSVLAEFARYDRDGDGVITPAECRHGPGMTAAEPVAESAAEDASLADAPDPADAAEQPATATAEPADSGAPRTAPPADAAEPDDPPRRPRRSRSR